MFIQLSQLTKWPLYVSPFLSSTSCGGKERQELILPNSLGYFVRKELKFFSP